MLHPPCENFHKQTIKHPKLMPTLSENPLHQDFEYFLMHRDRIIDQHLGEFVVICDQKVVGYFSSQLQAIGKMRHTRAIGTFLIQRCESDEESYTQTFHSRVSV